MASFRKLPSGLWQASVLLPDRKRVTRTDPLKKVVIAWAAETEAAVRRGKWKDPRKTTMTIGQWKEAWAAARIIEPETQRSNNASWDHLKKTFADVQLTDLTKLDVEKWVAAQVKKGTGPHALRKALEYLTTMIESAVENEKVGRNIARLVKAPEPPKKAPMWFTQDEVTKILKVMRGLKWEQMAVMTEVMVWGGLRWGEAAALAPMDVLWERSIISVTRTVTQAGKDKPYPKTSSSIGEVPIPAWLIKNLRALEVPGEPGTKFFRTRRGGVNLNGARWRIDWDGVLEKAEVRTGTPHTCRHTCASWLVQAGVPLYDVRRHLRHAQAATTERYAHLAPEVHDAVLGAWDRMGG